MNHRETADEFFDRTYRTEIKREAVWLVWPSKTIKMDRETKIKPERWDRDTVMNYVDYLEKNNEGNEK